MTVFREFQFIVQPVLLLEEDGKVPRPEAGEPAVLIGLDELRDYIDRFPDALRQLNASTNGD